MNNPEEGRQKGKLARELMISKYSPEKSKKNYLFFIFYYFLNFNFFFSSKVTETVLNRLREIQNELNRVGDPESVNLPPEIII